MRLSLIVTASPSGLASLVFLASALALAPRPSLAQPVPEISGGVSISGFFDVQATNPRNDPSVVSMGDFELDFARELGKNVQVGAAVVVNEEGASLAVAFVDFHLFGGLIAPRGKLPVEKGFHVQLGRFDAERPGTALPQLPLTDDASELFRVGRAAT